MDLQAVVLAAGRGSRMRSSLPKVCHTLAGRPLLWHVLDSLQSLPLSHPPSVVVGHQAERVQSVWNAPLCWVTQSQLLGTAHAVAQTLPHLKPGRLLVLLGDVPLIQPQTLEALLQATPMAAVGLLSAEVPDPHGLGRVIRDPDGRVLGIKEHRDATPEEQAIGEVFSGVLCCPVDWFASWWPQASTANAQREYYLTAMVADLVQQGREVVAHRIDDHSEIMGINDRRQLAVAERIYQQRMVQRLLDAGVQVMDPNRLDVRGQLSVGMDSQLDLNVLLTGHVSIGQRCCVGAHSVIHNSVLGDDVVVLPHSVIDGAEIQGPNTIGPFARLRPGTVLEPHAQVGNFVEIKASTIGSGSKVMHLSYLGDSQVGERANVGAGTITCNYDGANKHTTHIGDDAFVGSNSALVAPVQIGERAWVAAGSTITTDVPDDALGVARGRQDNKTPWQRPVKKSKVE